MRNRARAHMQAGNGGSGRQAGRRQATQRNGNGSSGNGGSAAVQLQAAGSCSNGRRANGNGNGGRQYKAAKRGKNARKHASRINTQTQAQTPLKTLYTASAVQFTQTAAPTHEKKHTNCTITTQKQVDCRESTQKRKTVYKNKRKKACNAVRAGVL